jgi:hypothetical protein
MPLLRLLRLLLLPLLLLKPLPLPLAPLPLLPNPPPMVQPLLPLHTPLILKLSRQLSVV